jgi:hypothetical protein
VTSVKVKCEATASFEAPLEPLHLHCIALCSNQVAAEWRTSRITQPISKPCCNVPSGSLRHSPLIGRTSWRTRHSHAQSIGFVCKREVLRLAPDLGVALTTHQAARGPKPFALSAFASLCNGGRPPLTPSRTAMEMLQLDSFTYANDALDAFTIPNPFLKF